MKRFLTNFSPDKDNYSKEKKQAKSPELTTSVNKANMAMSTNGSQYTGENKQTDMSAILQEINVKLTNLDTISQKVSNIETCMNEMQKSVNFAMETAQEAKSLASSMQTKLIETERKCCELSDENKVLKVKHNSLQEQLLRIESQSRRSNLNFDNIPESENEKPDETLRKARQFMIDIGVTNADSIVIERCHRRVEKKKPRTIIIKFLQFGDRERVFKQGKSLPKGGPFRIREDFPSEYEKRRAILIPVLQAAKRDKRFKENAHLSVDRLYINGRAYGHDELHTLPDGLRPEQVATRTLDDTTLFFRKDSPFSNFHPAVFTADGITYNCCEQYYQAKKAEFFSDDGKHQEIMKETDPRRMWAAGRKIKDYDEQKWHSEAALKVMEKGVMIKFQQNDQLRTALLRTGETRMVECNPKDFFWGSGLSIFHPHATDPSQWKGKNKLGDILQYVRNVLKSN